MGQKRAAHKLPGQIGFFDEIFNPFDGQQILRHSELSGYKAQTITSGTMLEIEIFPIWKRGEKKRIGAYQPSREAQAKLNHKNRQKHKARIINENFTGADVWATFSYSNANLPDTPEDATKEFKNFIRRLKRRRERLGLPKMRYIYVTEWREKTDGEYTEIRVHHHIVMSGGMCRDEIENMWRGGGRNKIERLIAEKESGLTGLAYYLTKAGTDESMWGHSTGLIIPRATESKTKITRRKAAQLATGEINAAAYFENSKNGYKLNKIEVKRSEHAAGVYIYVQMYKDSKDGQIMKKQTEGIVKHE
jgi:hypothetical protein